MTFSDITYIIILYHTVSKIQIVYTDIFLCTVSVSERSIMSCELKLYINGEIKKAFLLSPLMNESNITRIVHSHKYAEIHIISGGSATLLVENERHTLSSGCVCLVPAESYHCYLEAEPGVELIAFQTNANAREFRSRKISEAMLAETVEVIKNGDFCSDCSGLSALLSYAVSAFFPPVSVSKTEDIGVVIYEFISRNYNKSITVGDLAKKLYLSERQTERLVKKYTGHTFKEAVTNYRLTVAGFLEKNTDMNKADIAGYVGYLNYSGYYKADKRHEKKDT